MIRNKYRCFGLITGSWLFICILIISVNANIIKLPYLSSWIPQLIPRNWSFFAHLKNNEQRQNIFQAYLIQNNTLQPLSLEYANSQNYFGIDNSARLRRYYFEYLIKKIRPIDYITASSEKQAWEKIKNLPFYYTIHCSNKIFPADVLLISIQPSVSWDNRHQPPPLKKYSKIKCVHL